jgi:vancomycin resistance protein YoaR
MRVTDKQMYAHGTLAMAKARGAHAKAVDELSSGTRVTHPWDDPAAAGLAVDYDASVAAAGGSRSWAPERLWAYYTGGEELPPVVTVDQDAMHAALVDLTEQVGAPARDGDLAFGEGSVRPVPAGAGRAVDPTTASAAIEAAYLADDGAPPPEITTVPTRPDIDQQDVQQALDTWANAAVSGPVTIVVDRAALRLSAQEFGPLLGALARDGRLVPEVDERRLVRLVERAVSRRTDPVDASFRIADGEPVVVPAGPGVRFGPDAVADALLRAIRAPGGERRATVATRSEPADLSTREARGLGVVERVATSTTAWPVGEDIDTEVAAAATALDGTLLQPGQTLSYERVVRGAGGEAAPRWRARSSTPACWPVSTWSSGSPTRRTSSVSPRAATRPSARASATCACATTPGTVSWWPPRSRRARDRRPVR